MLTDISRLIYLTKICLISQDEMVIMLTWPFADSRRFSTDIKSEIRAWKAVKIKNDSISGIQWKSYAVSWNPKRAFVACDKAPATVEYI